MAKTKVTGGYIADSAITSDHLHTTLDLSTKTLTIGATTVSGHLIPDTNITYDLGSSTYRFRDIYLDGTTINLGGTELKKNSDGDIEFKSGSNFKRLVVSELEFDDGTNRKKFKISSGRIKSFDSSGVSDTADKISLSSNTTDDLGEGSSNLYFTTARARSSFSASTGIAITDGAISAAAVPNSSLTNSSVTINSNSLSLGGTLTLDTDDIGEGSTNLYYTTARWDTKMAAADTDDLSEGSTNLYYTTARWDTKMAAADTDDLSEGSTNLYFTNARARGAISVSGNALSYNSSTGVLTANYEESPSFTGNVTISGYVSSAGAYFSDTLRVLNSAGDGWNNWATRSAGNFNLSVGTINSGSITVDPSGSYGNGITINAGDNLDGTYGAKQILMTWGGSTTIDYAHSIRTRHNSNADTGNTVEVYLWDYGTDSSTTIGTKRALVLENSTGLDLLTGGYKVGGTTVINSSRNLTNIGTINSGQLNVNVGTANTIAVFESTDDKGFIQIKDNDTNAHLIAKDGNFSIADDSGTFDTFRIDLDTGNVDISGTFDSGAITSTSSITGTSLDINGNAAVSGYLNFDGSDQSGLLRIGGSNVIGKSNNFLYIDPNNSFSSGIYINNQLKVDGGLISSYNEDLQLRAAGTTVLTLATADSSATFAGTVEATSFSDGTISGITFIDEDSFATNSATRVPTQQSIKAYVDAQVAGVVDSAPAALNTLNELANALGDDANFSTTTSDALGNRLRVDTASQGLTGTQQANAITNLGITATKAELNVLDGITATVTELNYTDGVTSNIQTQLDAKPEIFTSAYTGTYNIPIHSGGGLYTSPNAGGVTITGSTGQISTPSHGNSSQWNTAYGWGNHASAGYTTASGNNTFTGRNFITVQDATDGGTSAGIYMWTDTDSNWVIYMSQSGSGKAADGGTAAASIDGRTAHHIRYRVNNNANQGHLWENNSDQTLMSLGGNNGYLYTRGNIYPSNQTTNYVDSTRIANWQTAYGWGDHASAGYLTSSSTQSKYLRSDATDTATGEITFSGDLKYGADGIPIRSGTISVGGDADTYYPVTWYGAGSSQAFFKKIQIYRNYSETAPSSWNTASHRGGLLLDLEANWGGWGGVNYDIKVNEFTETYSTMVAKIAHFANNRGFAIWLRGGTATYHFTVEGDGDPTVRLSAYDPGGNSTGVSSMTSLDQDTITDRLYFRGGGLYDSGQRVIRAEDSNSANVTITGVMQANNGYKVNSATIINNSGTIQASAGITSLDINNGISGSNYNISGVNALIMNDPGEGIEFNSSGGPYLYCVDDANDNILRVEAPGGLQIYDTGVDSLVDIVGNSSYDPVLNLRSDQSSITGEGLQIWYDNSVGDAMIHTTYNNNAASIRFLTKTGASKSKSNERMRIDGSGYVQITSHTNNWEGGLRMVSSDGTDTYQIHPDNNGYMYVDKNWYFTGAVHIGSIGTTALTTATTFGGDVSGTYNNIAIADDSHNHVISNVDGLQTALDAKLTSSSGLNASNINSGTLSNDRLNFAELGESPVGCFGQFTSHSAYATNGFNAEPAYWGWTFIQGTTGAPASISNQWYRLRTGLGDQYGKGTASGDYWLELAVPRYGDGYSSNNSTPQSQGTLWARTCESGSPGSWSQIGGELYNGLKMRGSEVIDTNGNIKLQGGDVAYFYTGSNVLRGYIYAQEVNDAHFVIQTSGGEDIAFKDSSATNMIIRANSQVQIGAYGDANPSLTLASSQGGASEIRFNDNNSTEGSYIKSVAASGSTGGDIKFGSRWDSDTDRIYMEMTGTTVAGPNAMFKMASGAFMFGGNNSGKESNSAQISAGMHQSNSLNFVGMSSGTTSGTRRMDFWVEGKAYFRGDVVATGNVTAYGSASDKRLKKDIVKIDNAIDKIKSVTGYEFAWNENAPEDKQDKREFGVIAQEVEEAGLDKLVFDYERPVSGTDEDNKDLPDEKWKAVHYDKFVPILIEAMKEQQELIEKLTARIEELEK